MFVQREHNKGSVEWVLQVTRVLWYRKPFPFTSLIYCTTEVEVEPRVGRATTTKDRKQRATHTGNSLVFNGYELESLLLGGYKSIKYCTNTDEYQSLAQVMGPGRALNVPFFAGI